MYRLSDRFFTLTLWAGGLTGVIAVFLILCFLVLESIPALNAIGIARFFNDPAWYPLENEYNLLPMLIGSVFITIGAVFLSLPLALGSAVYLVFFLKPQFQPFALRLLEVLGGIPSVIFCLWGMVSVVPLIAKIDGPGTSLLAGSIVVTMMILPALILMFAFILKRNTNAYYLQGISVGLAKEKIIFRVIIPSATNSLGGALILQTTRAIGETMAVLMVCGNITQIPDSIFDPVRTLTSNTALEMAYAMGDHRSSLFFGGLLLTLLVGLLLLILKVFSSEYKFNSRANPVKTYEA